MKKLGVQMIISCSLGGRYSVHMFHDFCKCNQRYRVQEGLSGVVMEMFIVWFSKESFGWSFRLVKGQFKISAIYVELDKSC